MTGFLQRMPLSRTIFTLKIRSYSTSPFPFPNPPAIRTLCTPEDMQAAQTWVDEFRSATSPSAKCLKDTGTFAYARSSGPGGQNVNKVNTKAIFRVPVLATEGGSVVRWIPLWALDGLVKDPRYALSSKSLVLSSDAHRSQSANVEECLDKLRNLVIDASSASIVRPTSEETKKMVKTHVDKFERKRKEEKMKKSAVKAGRNSKGWDF